MNVGQAIKMCRTRRGVSQTDLAQRAECSVSYLSMLENKRDPTLSTLTKIAHSLNVPMGILFFLAAEREELGSIDKELAGDLARTALELLSEPFSDQLPLV